MFEAPRQMRSALAGAGTAPAGAAPLNEIDFQRLASDLWRGRRTILAATAAALVLALLLIAILPHRFTATTQILIDPMDLRAVGTEITPNTQILDAALLQAESQVRVIGSDSVLRRVVDSEHLDRDPEFSRAPSALRLVLDDVLAALGIGAGMTADRSLAALTELKRRVDIRRAERTYVVEIGATSKNAGKAARIANAIAQAYLAEQTEVRSDAARQVSQSLSDRLSELKNRVRVAEEKVEAFKARNAIIGANGQLIDEQQLSDMNYALGAARARTAAAKARLEQIEAVQKSKDQVGAFPEALQSATITALRSQYAEVLRREAEQKTTLGWRHPAVTEIEAQAERLRSNIADEVNRIAQAAGAEYDGAKADQDLLAGNLETLKRAAIATNESMVGLRELERDAQASRTVYEAFLVRAQESGAQERLDTKNIQVISKAEPPLRRSSPPSTLVVALGAIVLGFAAGSGIVLLRPPGLEPASPQASLGAAARHKLSRLARRLLPVAPITADMPVVPVLASLPGVDVSFGLNAADDPTSRFALGIRKIHDAVRASRDGNPSVLIAASDDADDTAAVALTLAAVAAAKQKVLLIDADLERRTLCAIDAEQSDSGLVDVAVGRRRLADVITRDKATNINLASFVASASRRDRPISDADVKAAFDMTKSFDMVIVAAIDFRSDPSARFFAGLVDHIVLVARADQSDDAAVAQFISVLGADAQKVRGTVRTGVGAG
jgi:succinoglycan biosynthesis transport protein ExoP